MPKPTAAQHLSMCPDSAVKKLKSICILAYEGQLPPLEMKRASCAVRHDQTGESIRFIALPKHGREDALWRLRSSNYREISALDTIICLGLLGMGQRDSNA